MKKLMVLALVLGIASFASAGLDFLVDGAPAAGADVQPGVLSITGEQVSSYDLTLVLAGVTIDTAGITFPTAFDFAGKIVSEDATSLRVSASQFFGAPQTGVLVDGVVVAGEGTISVIDNATGGEIALINIVPEPMTLGLLGLGGLFIRRKK